MAAFIATSQQNWYTHLASSVLQAPAQSSARAAQVGLGDVQVHNLPVGGQLRLQRIPTYHVSHLIRLNQDPCLILYHFSLY